MTRRKERPEEIDRVPLRKSGEVESTRALHEQIAEQRQIIANLRRDLRRAIKAANTDSLTGIFNRKGVEDAFTQTLDRHQGGVIIVIDLDKFKPINDRFGHEAGDEALKLVARTLAFRARKGIDIVARFGGDEFVIVMPGMTDEKAQIVAERLRDAFSDMTLVYNDGDKEHAIKIEASIGAEIYHPGDDIGTTIKAADKKMYASKNEKGLER